MSNKEISIAEFELQDCAGNLKTLQTNWLNVPTVPVSTLTQSEGKSADAVRGIISATQAVSDSFQNLLENSCDFSTQMGIYFQESDEQAAKTINLLA